MTDTINETLIENRTYDAERSLYHLQNAEVRSCTFAGEADGESVLKEGRHITVSDCRFSLRYPLWHVEDYRLLRSTMDEKTRAPIWYAFDGHIEDCEIRSVKALRECQRTTVINSRVTSTEFGWRCRELTLIDSSFESEYFLFEAAALRADNLTLKGKYSFQYVKDAVIKNSYLDTKDAFWHAENVLVENSVVKGEYLGWFSRGLTFKNCRIIGTQPLCYCKDLTLIDCTMEETDLSFEYSEVQASVIGPILSVKNPEKGEIVADGFGEVIFEDSIMESTCTVKTREDVLSF